MKRLKKTTKEPATRSPRLAARRKTAACLARSGWLDKKTMRAFGTLCLTKAEPMTGAEFQVLCCEGGEPSRLGPSLERVRPELVSGWECHLQRPSGLSLKLLSLVKTKATDAIA